MNGNRVVARRGFLSSLAVMTSVSHVALQMPKVRDRSDSDVKSNSALLPTS